MSINYKVVILLHLFATSAMCAVIWIVQLVHYPSFKYIDLDRFSSFEIFHQNTIALIVLPLMLLEVATYGLLFKQYQAEIRLLLSGIVLLVLWISTFFIYTPIHQKLEIGFNLDLVTQLIQTNWVRTIGWSIRTLYIFRFSSKYLIIQPILSLKTADFIVRK